MGSYLRPLFEHVVNVSEAHSSSELSKDLPEELLRIDVGAPGSVVLLLAGPGSTGVESRRSVRVVLLPLHLVAQHLHTRRADLNNLMLLLIFHLLLVLEVGLFYLIGFSQFGELLFGLWVVWVGVRVVLLCQLVRDDSTASLKSPSRSCCFITSQQNSISATSHL